MIVKNIVHIVATAWKWLWDFVETKNRVLFLVALLFPSLSVVSATLFWSHASFCLKIIIATVVLLMVVALLFVARRFLWIRPSAQGSLQPRYLHWYKNPLRRVGWNFENYLCWTADSNKSFQILGFQARLILKKEIRPHHSFIECRRTGIKQNVLLDINYSTPLSLENAYRNVREIESLPPGMYHVYAKFEKAGNHDKSTGMTKEAFLNAYKGLHFVFEYNEKSFVKFFSKKEMERLISYLENYLPSQFPQQQKVKLKEIV